MKQSLKYALIAALVFALAMPTNTFAWSLDKDRISEYKDKASEYINKELTEEQKQKLLEKKDQAEKLLKNQLDRKKDIRQEFNEKKEQLKKKVKDGGPLTVDKKKICEKHESRINQLKDKMNDRGSEAYGKITSIFEGITEYYGERNVTVEEYDTLAATALAAQETAKKALDEQLVMPDFDCDSDKPHVDIANFREKRFNAIEALLAYRKAVKTLGNAIKEAVIVAKKEAAKEIE